MPDSTQIILSAIDDCRDDVKECRNDIKEVDKKIVDFGQRIASLETDKKAVWGTIEHEIRPAIRKRPSISPDKKRDTDPKLKRPSDDRLAISMPRWAVAGVVILIGGGSYGLPQLISWLIGS